MRLRRALGLSVLLAAAPPVAADDGLHHVLPQLALSAPCGTAESCLNTWSLASRMGQALAAAEALYGPRDRSWTILGVEFTTRPQPGIWYPSFPGDTGTIILQLTKSAATDEAQALFQLGHEVIHLLSPTGDANTSVLEEGLAMIHAVDYARATGADIGPDYNRSPAYRAAYDSVFALREAHGPVGFQAGIRVLRTRLGTLSSLDDGDLAAAFPQSTAAERLNLRQPFSQ